MNLYLNEILQGFKDTLALGKQAENIFEMGGNHALFPNIDSQQKWRFAKADKNIRLSDGQQVYNFNAPEGEHQDQEFPLERGQHLGMHEFEQGATSKGLAQVHRADPGHIYFTLQEGKNNPTYTFRHVGDNKWKGIPKAKKKKNTVEGIIPLQPHPPMSGPGHPQGMTNPLEQVPGHNMPGMPGNETVLSNMSPGEVKQAFVSAIKKQASPWLEAGDNAVHAGMYPGRDPMMSGMAGAAGGLGYHLLKKNSIIRS